MSTQTVPDERTEASRLPRKLRPLGTFVHERVSDLQHRFLRKEAAAVATLAQLRRGVAKEVGALPELWEPTLAGLPGPEPRDDAPTTVEERAAYTAITLYALHQQSKSEGMHRRGQGVGTAVRALQRRVVSEDAVRRRFLALGTAETFTEVVHHARSLITQLRGHGIPLDYGAFADDLCWLQTRAATRVRLAWGRDFYRTDPKPAASEQQETGTSEIPAEGR